MQEEMTGQAVALAFQTAELSLDLIKDVIAAYLELQKNKSHYKEVVPEKAPKVKQGKQTAKQLVGQGVPYDSTEIQTSNIKMFDASARKFGVDYAPTVDKSTKPPTHTILFKGKDTAAITSAFKDFMRRGEKKLSQDEKKSISKELERLQKVTKEADLTKEVKEKDKSHEMSR